MNTIVAEAPSNIALIKYMGKVVGQGSNLPINSSLSLTLPEFRTRIEITPCEDQDDVVAMNEGLWLAPELSEKGREKFLNHFKFLKTEWNIQGHFEIKSGNNFPADCGIASSASSFAALTLGTYNLAKSQNPKLDLTTQVLASLSRRGSGSSCRSFGPDFVLWSGDQVQDIHHHELGGDFHHELILVDQGKKEVSSSDAHKRVAESSMFAGRKERAEGRLTELQQSLRSGDRKFSWQIVWDEFWDMHTLFHTSKPPFSYMTPKTLQVLEMLRSDYITTGDGPIVTMDAGANIHLLYRFDQKSIWSKLESTIKGLECLVGRKGPGHGAN